MAAEQSLAREVAQRQLAMFAMFVGPGLYTTRAALSAASGYPTSTLKEWAHGAAMPFHAVLGLRKYLPAEAINMLSEPGGVRLVATEEAEGTWSEIAVEAAAFNLEYLEASSDGHVDHCERAAMVRRLRTFVARAQRVIGEGSC